jgi:hypothetical protein
MVTKVYQEISISVGSLPAGRQEYQDIRVSGFFSLIS